MKAHATASLLTFCMLGACTDPPQDPEPTSPEVPPPEASVTAPETQCARGSGETVNCDAFQVRS
jgi:hypothetical protein